MKELMDFTDTVNKLIEKYVDLQKKYKVLLVERDMLLEILKSLTSEEDKGSCE